MVLIPFNGDTGGLGITSLVVRFSSLKQHIFNVLISKSKEELRMHLKPRILVLSFKEASFVIHFLLRRKLVCMLEQESMNTVPMGTAEMNQESLVYPLNSHNAWGLRMT